MKCNHCGTVVSDDSLYCSKCGRSILGTELQITRDISSDDFDSNSFFDLKPDQTFGERYKIVCKLGQGGMGIVYKAHDEVLDLDVALKMIRPEYLKNNKMISRFKREILLAREISHENVSRIHDFGEVDGIKFISMEFISGRTLKEMIREEGPIEIERAIEISKAICSGLFAAHKKKIIHRDLKPQNIMIDELGHVFITDFGLAKSTGEENISQSELVIGTPLYIPPELWNGEEVDHRSDIYSLGVVFYEMITGEELYKSDSDYGYLQKHVNEYPKFPPGSRERLPVFFRNLVLKCLSKDRDKRYQDCSEVYRDLKYRMFSKGVFLSKIEKSIKKSGPVWFGILFLLVLLVTFTVNLIIDKSKIDQKKRSVAILYFKNLSGIEDLDHYSFSLQELLTTDIGQSKYIKVLPDDEVSKLLKVSNYLSSNFLDEKVFKKIGNDANVNYLVQGSFIKSGDDLRITVKLRDSGTGEMISSDYVDTPMDNIFPAIDRLTKGLKKRFDLTENEIFSDIDSDVESITTSSHDALNHYITGKRLFLSGDLSESLKEYKKAVNIDPEFAMAYRNIAYTYAYLNDWGSRSIYFKKAIQNIDKLSEREKYLIYGDYYSEKEITFQKAIDSYKKILDIYPYDFEANFQSGMLYRMFEEWDKGIKHLTIACKEDSSDVHALKELVNCYAGKEEFEKAEELVLKYEAMNGNLNQVEIMETKYFHHLYKMEFEFASEIVDKMNMLNKDDLGKPLYNKGEILILQGDYEKSKKIIKEIMNSGNQRENFPSVKRLSHVYLYLGNFKMFESYCLEVLNANKYFKHVITDHFDIIDFYMNTGQLGKARKELGKINLPNGYDFPDRKQILLTLRIQLEIDSGNIQTADKLVLKLKKLVDKSIFKVRSFRRYYYVLAKIEEKKKNFKDAEKYYLKILDYVSDINNYRCAATYFYEVALFHYKRDKLEKAEKYFKSINTLSTGRFFRGDFYAKSFYYLGKIYQSRRWTEKAIDSFEKFYKMWKDGDPEFVARYIKDCREQLKILRRKI